MEPVECNALQKMRKFVGNIKVKTLNELVKSNETGVFVVVAWFVSVAEGIDMWFPDLSVESKPRFRLKLKVKDVDEVAVFSLFDADVECLAMETCPLLHSMGESCSLFPEEMDCYYGEAMMYKVEKQFLVEDGKIYNFKVVSICNEVEIVNEFIDEYLPHIENKLCISCLEEISPKGSSKMANTLNSQIEAVVADELLLPNTESLDVGGGNCTEKSVVPLGDEFLIEGKPANKADYLAFQKFKSVLEHGHNSKKRITHIVSAEGGMLNGQKRTKHGNGNPI